MIMFLRILTIVLGIAIVLISLLHLFLGPAAIPGSVPVNATMDSEDRFYAMMFLAYGIALLWCARHMEQRMGEFQLLMIIFFVGGIARIASILAVGLPNVFFQVMTAIELVTPPVLIFISRIAAKGR